MLAISNRTAGTWAMTLTEVIVYCFLLAVFSVTAFLSMPASQNRSLENLEHATTEMSLVMTRLSKEMSNSSRSRVIVSTEPRGVVFLSASTPAREVFTYNSSGELLWEGWVGYFLVKGELLRTWQPLKVPAVVASVGSAPMTQELLGARPVPVARGINEFRVVPEKGNVFRITARLEIQGSSMELQSGVVVRNR